VQQALGQAGLESSNLIVGIDFTKSNEWTGKVSFNRRSLHSIGNEPNPYEQAISIIGQTLSPFDEDNLIPCFGFGDASTHDQKVFSFFPDHRPCAGFEEALSRYRTIVPHLKLAGPTSFAPIVDAAVDIVEESGGQYHVLIIIADGQVTRSVDTGPGYLSPQERMTIDAIVAASFYPLSIVLVGVGDGPWDMMQQFDDNIPARSFDNFQFVNFSKIMERNLPPQQKEALFALSALMEIPEQYKATIELGILGQQRGQSPGKKPLPPPNAVLQADAGAYGHPQPSGYGSTHGVGRSNSYAPDYNKPPSYSPYGYPPANLQSQYSGRGAYGYPSSGASSPPYNYPPSGSASPPTAPTIGDESPQRREDTDGGQNCPVCLTEKKDMAFNCGHQTCRGCGAHLTTCPICRENITTRIRLY
jgi:E3 ubiquitin-protein ligase RGLG